MSNTALYQCEDCGYSTNNPVAFALHPCRPNNGVNWNSRAIAAFVAIVLAMVLMLPAKAQTPQPTPTVGGGPQIAVEHKLFLPLIATSETVHGCDDCGNVNADGRYWGGQQAVSWCPSCNAAKV